MTEDELELFLDILLYEKGIKDEEERTNTIKKVKEVILSATG